MNQEPFNVLIIGAGGVASYMLPALNNSFNLKGYLIDGDKLEEHNLDRQIFSPRQVGQFKADALIKHNKVKGLTAINQYIDMGWLENSGIPEDFVPDVIITLVDNHPARRAAIEASVHYDCALVIGANEYSTSQALYWHPILGYNRRPDVRYPHMRTSQAGSPLSCTGDALESTPQLAIANMVSAGFVNYLLWLWHGADGYDVTNTAGYEVIEYQSTFSRMETTTLNDTTN